MRPRLLPLALLLLAGCDREVPNPGDPGVPEPDAPNRPQVIGSAQAGQASFDPRQVARGEALYRSHCAQCHGPAGEGAADWRRQLPDGRWPPPPLDGSGHAWHHPYRWLVQKIKSGSPPELGDMPPWQERLADGEIADIIAWFQSTWPDEVYAAWREQDARSQRAER